MITMNFGIVLTLFAFASLATAYVNDWANCNEKTSRCVPFVKCTKFYKQFLDLREKAAESAVARSQLERFINSIHKQSCGFDPNNLSVPLVCCPLTNSQKEISDDLSLITEKNSLISCGVDLRQGRSGNKTGPYDHPWLALLEYDSWVGYGYRKKVLCGGVLLSDRYVLTSSDCVQSPSNKVDSVILGEHNLEAPESLAVTDAPQQIKVGRIITERELTLLELKRQVQFSSTIQPICLPYSDELPEQALEVAGWSKSFIPDEEGLTEKLQSQLTEIKVDNCHNQILKFDSSNQICAGTPSERACVADAGGPLMGLERKRNGARRMTVFGVSTMSLSCKNPLTQYVPGIFDKIYDYVDWINEYVKV